MGPQDWALYFADRLKERFQEALVDIDRHTLGYALMDFAEECPYDETTSS